MVHSAPVPQNMAPDENSSPEEDSSSLDGETSSQSSGDYGEHESNDEEEEETLSLEDEKHIFTHIHSIDKQLIQWYSHNTSKRQRSKHMKANNNTNAYTLPFLKDLYAKRRSVIDILNKPYWLFCLESNRIIHNKIINFIDGDILGTFLKDVQLLPDLEGSSSYQATRVWKSNRLVLKFLFQRDNGVLKNNELCIYIYIDHTAGTLMLDWTKTRIAQELAFDEDGCWKYGGPHMLLDGFFKIWRNKSDNEGEVVSEDERIREMEDMERGILAFVKGVVFHSVPSFHSGIKVMFKKEAEPHRSAIGMEPKPPTSLLHTLTFGYIPDYIKRVDDELNNAEENNETKIIIPFWLLNDKERGRRRFRFKVMKHFDLCFVLITLAAFLLGIYYLTLYRYIGNNDGKDWQTGLKLQKPKQRTHYYEDHPHKDVYENSFL